MCELFHELSHNLENEQILWNHKIERTHSLVPNLKTHKNVTNHVNIKSLQ